MFPFIRFILCLCLLSSGDFFSIRYSFNTEIMFYGAFISRVEFYAADERSQFFNT